MLERVQRRQETISRKLEQVGKAKAMDISDDSSSDGDEEADCKTHEIPYSDNKDGPSNEQGEQDSKPKPYRSRLAALAENINNWEDDLSHPQIKSKEAVKRAWKPHVTNASETATASLILKKGNTGTSKVTLSSGNTAKREIRRSNSSTNTPPAKSGYMQPSPGTGRSNSLRTSASCLATGASSASSENDVPVVNTETESDADNALTALLSNSSKSTSTRNKTSRNSGSKSAAVPSQQVRRTSVSRAGPTGGRRSSIAEPTKQPVAARLAAWKQKSKESEKSAEQSRPFTSQKSTRRPLSKIDEAAEKENLKESAVRSGGSAGTNSKSLVPNSNQIGTSQAEHLTPAQLETASKSSPKKLGQATLTIQEKLSQMCENWKQGQVAEKSRQERTAEIQAVANRWKNGILVDTGNTSDDEAAVKTKNSSVSSSNPELQKLSSAASLAPPANSLTTCQIPVPPPLPPPPPLSSGFSAKKVVTSVQQPLAAAIAFSKDLSVRRAVKFNSCPKPFVKPKDASNVNCGEKQSLSKDQDTEDTVEPVCDQVSNQLAANFETNLIAMGYQVSPEGSAAVIDLKVFKEPEPPKLFAPRTHPILSSVKKVKMVGRTVTTTRFDDHEKVTVTKKKVATLPMASSLGKASGATTERVNSKKTAEEPTRSASVSSGRSGNLYSLIKAQARQALEVKAPAGMPVASSKIESVDSAEDSFESSASSSGIDSPPSHHRLEQMPIKEPDCSSSKWDREPVPSSKWDSSSDSNSQYSDNTAEVFHPPQTKRPAYSQLKADDRTDTDDAYSEMDEPELRARSLASTQTKRLIEEGVYMEMTQQQPTSSIRQAPGLSSPKVKSSAKTRRVQFVSDIDATTYTASDTDDGMSSSSSRCPPSCDDTYDVIWDSESSGNCCEAPPVPAVSRQWAETFPDFPRRNLATSHPKDRPATIAGLPQARPLEHRADTRHQMAAFFERRYQQRRPACRSENERYKTPSLPHKSAQHRLQSLQEMVHQEEKILVQASNALEVCSRGVASFVGTSEAVECHRVLLVSSRKREALLMEMKRVREGLPSSEPTGLAGRLAAVEIRLPLKPEFIAKIGTLQDASIHYFVMLLRSGVNVAFAQTVSTLEPMVLGSLEVRSRLQLSGIPEHFSIDLEIYAMVVPRDQKVNTPKKSKHAATQLELLTPKSARKAKPSSSYMPSIRASNFVQIASLELTDRALNKTHFALDGVAYACPLQGTIHLRLRHVMEAFIHQRGFLTICTEDSGVWNRRWCTLNSNEILCWKHPNDELTKEPVITVDLRSCITGKVVAMALGHQSEATSVEIVTVKDSRRGGACYSDNILPTRHWLTADSTEECQEWTNKLNQILNDLRAWHPYANPSVRLPSEDTLY